ncbi:putative Uncharacterized transposase-like protein [Monocercomonoides exilis]|uniref:putative Uncharacterized transposase-like protein n=1 Tax=Monocercomonoides exilis TaxID=2049356 RepID=UPI003559C106|nr:putative Uncharacterized transposase-like protein [Monocercomonoides exilis]|eukprot:MONOS_10935.1-p1 / transcript=MONOS_10935.1 / gene=MONOS_10935 / organism=Monocercomonoides_exilis_PA203 / gene_product=Uncharacterized transposase-like protein HI1328.1 / transcript_product=Uncharacterized transposase-like protein HI1328.1 / location=Mono_scaffold00520:11731-12806(+) / protein_length=263 / sequence_SO=supercontig / SO=protein_coding / is_pseudo=false
MSLSYTAHICELLGISENTIHYWTSVIRVRCTSIWNKNQAVIGGPGRIVEIDEAVWRRRKYGRGKKKRQIWIFGAVERKPEGGAGKNFVMIVPNRKAGTLVPIIRDKILPGTRIMSDEWKAYARLKDYGYAHDTVCHKREFKNKITHACTNTVEGLWMNLRKFFPRTRCREKFLGDYLSMWLVRRNLQIQFRELIKEIVFDLTEKENESEESESEVSDSTESELESDILDENDILQMTEFEKSDSLGAGDGASASEFDPMAVD